MNAQELHSQYSAKLLAKEKAEGDYNSLVCEIGEKISKSQNFHRYEYVDSIYGISDDGIISYGVSSMDSDCTGSGQINIKEIVDQI